MARSEDATRRASRLDANERAGSGNRREMMTKRDPWIRPHIVAAVVVHLRGRRAPVVQDQHPGCQPLRVETEPDRIGAQRRHEDVNGADVFPARESQRGIGARALEHLNAGGIKAYRAPEGPLSTALEMFKSTVIVATQHCIIDLVVMNEHTGQWNYIYRSRSFTAVCDDAVPETRIDDIASNLTCLWHRD